MSKDYTIAQAIAANNQDEQEAIEGYLKLLPLLTDADDITQIQALERYKGSQHFGDSSRGERRILLEFKENLACLCVDDHPRRGDKFGQPRVIRFFFQRIGSG